MSSRDNVPDEAVAISNIQRMMLSLDGLSVGDALGETFFGPPDAVLKRIGLRSLPQPPWPYTDDTQMALSIVAVLKRRGRIVPKELARDFTDRYEPRRGYGMGAHLLLQALRKGADWRVEAQLMFGGKGSYGNGAAMRIAPLGAYFADDLDAAAENAAASAQVTHAHPEGAAGAVAVAIGAALACRAGEGEAMTGKQFLECVASRVPAGETRRGIEEAAGMGFDPSPDEAAAVLGSGWNVSAQDTVPFTLWCAALHFDDYEEAFWAAVSGLGDRDTTCAIVGGIVALSAREKGIPVAWLKAREPLPEL